MKRQCFLLFIFFSSFPGSPRAQVNLSFNEPDSSFLPSPWGGDVDKYMMLGQQLSNYGSGEASEKTFLSYPSSMDSMAYEEWCLDFELHFNTSSTSYASYILASDRAELGAGFDGYIIHIGGKDDAISLYRTGQGKALIQGRVGLLNQAINKGSVRVLRDPWGRWSLWTKLIGEHEEYLEGRTKDLVFKQIPYLGLGASYTKTRWNKIRFDNMKYTHTSMLALHAERATVIDPYTVELVFNGSVHQVDTASFFYIDSGRSIYPRRLDYETDSSTISLHFIEALPSDKGIYIVTQNLVNDHGLMAPIDSIVCKYIIPELDTAMVYRSRQIHLRFSEAMDWEQDSQLRCVIDSNVWALDSLLSIDAFSCILFLKEELPHSKAFDLSISGLFSKLGYQMLDAVRTLIYYPPPPIRIESLRFLSARQIEILLTEEPGESAYKPAHYILEPKFSIDSILGYTKTIVLFLGSGLSQGEELSLEMVNIESKQGAQLGRQQASLVWYEAQPFDIIFTEMMVDPIDSVMLPEIEYLEIYNRSSYPICLKDWILDREGRVAFFPDYTIEAGDYFVLVKEGLCGRFSGDIKCMGIPKMPILPNTGGSISLIKPDGVLIDYMHYDRAFWGNSAYKDGGWSLERIDNDYLGAAQVNWAVSEAVEGGTPGEENSVKGYTEDGETLFVQSLGLLNAACVELQFSEGLHPNVYLHSPYFKLNGALEVDSFQLDENLLYLYLNASMNERQIYTLSIGGFVDCNGGLMRDTVLTLGIPEFPRPGDLCINELLFDPAVDGSEYVELLNVSNQLIDLSLLGIVVSQVSTLGSDDKIYAISDASVLLGPGEHIALTDDVSRVTSVYPKVGSLRKVYPFPHLPNHGAYVFLVTRDQKHVLIDEVYYHEDMHEPMFSGLKGVALERIDPMGAGLNPHNWSSAATKNNYGTPGFSNSHASLGLEDSRVRLSKQSFTPDGDGVNDELSIVFEHQEQGWMASCRIFDRYGRLQLILADARYLASSDKITWDGRVANGSMGRVGIYLIELKMFNAVGRVKYYRFPCVLSAKVR